MATKKSIRSTGWGGRKRNSGSTKTPKPRQFAGAKYLCSAKLAGYPINVFQAESLGNDNGMFFRDAGEMYVDGSQTPWGTAETLLHEVIHAVDCRVASPETGLTEEQVTQLSALLADALGNNKALRDLIFGYFDEGSDNRG